MGVVFGDVLETELGLKWVAVMDETRTQAVLRVGNTSVVINSLTLVHAEVGRGNVNLSELLERVRRNLR